MAMLHRHPTHGPPSVWARVFVACAATPRLRNAAIRAICRIEGGQMWSVTYRALMRRYFDLEIGAYSYGPCLFPGHAPAGTRVGPYCSLGPGILLLRRNHPAVRISQHPFFFNARAGLLEEDTIAAVHDRPLEIGPDVWIGANAIVTPGCNTIGLGAVIGAGAVVTRDIPPFTVVGGNPARAIRERFTAEVRELVLASRWWERPIEDLTALLPWFLEDVSVDVARSLVVRLGRHPTGETVATAPVGLPS